MFEYMLEREECVRKEGFVDGFNYAVKIFEMAYEKRYKELKGILEKINKEKGKQNKNKEEGKQNIQIILGKMAVINRDEKLLDILDSEIIQELLDTFSSSNAHFSFLLRFYTRSKGEKSGYLENICECQDKVNMENSVLLSYLCSSFKQTKEGSKNKLQFIKSLGKSKEMKMK